ncbi:MAG: hypothetical protein KatS3mg003_1400 [Candidatus Nitrosocaldaceae archaeon]|nr:MAG: hypothetical protein KatS3mg003_1400 [Candidatus Nitrosocaldaceae archaeon]
MNNLFGREYGYEYTRYEFKAMRRIKDYKVNRPKELIGYITKINDYYILRPTVTTINPYIICRSNEDIDGNVRIYGRWTYDINKSCIIFEIESYREYRIDYDEVLDDISYEQYKEMLFNNCMLDPNLKDIIAHLLISRIDRELRVLIKSGNGYRLLNRLNMFIPREFSNVTKVFIDELGSYLIIKPILSLSNYKPFMDITYYASEVYLTLDSIYIDEKVDEYHINQVSKFIVNMHMIDVDIKQNYRMLIDYVMSNNKRVNVNCMNLILALSIANAKINRQKQVEIDNIKYVMELLSNAVKVITL